MSGKVTLLLGSMLSGKSTELMRFQERAVYANKQCVVLRPTTDTRDYVSRQKNAYFPHFPDHTKLCPIVGIYPGNMQDMYAEVAGRDAELVLIDEAQFFGEDLYYYVNHIAVDYNASVVIAALSGDTNREPWPAVSKLIPYVDEVIKFNAVCQNPKCPHHSIDIGTFSAYDGIKKDKVLIGDETETETGKYIVLCRDCYEELRRKQTYV